MQLSILLLAIDKSSVQPLANALAAPGHGVTVVTRPDEAVSAAAGYSLLIVDQVTPPATLGDVVTMLRAGVQTAGVPVLAIAQTTDLEERIRLLEFGADDVIARPFDLPELTSRIDALALRSGSTAEAGRGIGDQDRHRLVTVFSPKGGVGTTTVATNLALVVAEAHPNKVLLIDLDLSFGQVASHLNLQPKQTLLELTRDEAALHDADLFRTYAIHHASGLHILAAPPSPSFAALVTGDHVDMTLARALEAYEFVVVDAGTALDQRLSSLFGLSEAVVIPVLPEIPALNSVHILMDQLAETGELGARTVFVLNNAFARDLLKRTDVETALGSRISAELPYDPIVYLKAANEGNPVVRGAAKSLPAEKLRALASIVFGATLLPGNAGDAKKEKRGLFGRR
ncbi:MAG TPA: AAA family ATPase [Candidatus Limnocylindrales bacterium]|nr:AAA family ATPase [Candidatus Limnocylindrales bacterium]